MSARTFVALALLSLSRAIAIAQETPDAYLSENLANTSVRFGPHSLIRQAILNHVHQSFHNSGLVLTILSDLASFARFFLLFESEERWLPPCFPIANPERLSLVFQQSLDEIVTTLSRPHLDSFLATFLGKRQFLSQGSLFDATRIQIQEFALLRQNVDFLLRTLPLKLSFGFTQPLQRSRIRQVKYKLVELEEKWKQLSRRFSSLVTIIYDTELSDVWKEDVKSFKKCLVETLWEFVVLVQRLKALPQNMRETFLPTVAGSPVTETPKPEPLL